MQYLSILNLELYLIQSLNGQSAVDEGIIKCIAEPYDNDLDIDKPQVKTAILKMTVNVEEMKCFIDVHKTLKKKALISKSIAFCYLFISNPATFCTPERLFSTARRVKKVLSRFTFSNRRFNTSTFIFIKNLQSAGLN